MGFKKRVKLKDLKPFKGRRNRNDGLDRINEERWEYDLPPISREEKYRRDAEYMDDKYGYDIGS